MNQFLSCFKVMKPVIGVIHTKGTDDTDMLRRAKEEIRIYKENGVDSFLVETYFGTYYQVEKVLDYVAGADLGMPYGVNCLNVDAMGFELARKFDCDYLQLDSVVGHVKPRDEDSLFQALPGAVQGIRDRRRALQVPAGALRTYGGGGSEDRHDPLRRHLRDPGRYRAGDFHG